MNCLHCGSPAVDETGICHACGVNQRIAAKAHNTSNYYYNLGLDRAKIRDLSGAEEALKMSLKYNKKNTNARNLLGLIYYDTCECILALSHWVISMNYDNSKKNPANRYVKQVQSSNALLDANGRLASKYNLALSYAESENIDLAIIQLKKLLSSNTHFVKGHLLMALLYMKAEDYVQARRYLKRALKVDRFNPTAIRFMKELNIPEEELEEDKADFDDLLPDTDIGEEERQPDLGDLLEGRNVPEAELSEASLKVGSYRDINFAKYTLVYVLVGLVLGIVTVSFLVLPSKINAVRNEYSDIKLTFSDEIAKKNATISTLETEKSDLENRLTIMEAEATAEEDTTADTSAYEKLIEAYALFEEDKVAEAIWTLEGYRSSDFENASGAGMFKKIMKAGRGDIYNNIYKEGVRAYEDRDYEKAIRYLSLASNITSKDVELWSYLLKAYKESGNLPKAQEIQDYITEKFPDSDYAGERRELPLDEEADADAEQDADREGDAEQGADEDNADEEE